MSDKKDPVNEFFGNILEQYKPSKKHKQQKVPPMVMRMNDKEDYQFPYHNDLFTKIWQHFKSDIMRLRRSCKLCYIGKDWRKTWESIKDWKHNYIYVVCNLGIITIMTIPAYQILKDYRVVFGAIVVKHIIQATSKALLNLSEVKKIQDRLIPYFKEDIIVNNVIYTDKKEKGILTVKSRIPFSRLSKETLEHALNYAIVDIIQDVRRLDKLRIEIVKGMTRDYLRAEKGTIERLESILRFYKDNPKYIETIEHESDIQHIFISRLGEKKLNRIITEVPSRLGIKKENLTIEYDEDKVIFTIKTIDQKQYFIDDFIRDTKRPNNNNYKIPFIFGMNRQTGKAMIFDYDSIQHMLIGGMTGSGKSSVTHGIIYSLMYWNDDIFFYMIDLKGTELPYTYKQFNNCSIVGIEDYETEDESINAVVSLVNEVYEEYRKRVRLFNDIGCKDLKGYNLKVNKRLPTIIFLIDEVNYLFEVLQKRNKQAFTIIESCINTLLSRGRSTGIYSIHTMQNITDKIYNINWRRSMMTRLCMKMAEVKQCQMIIENNTQLADKAYKQGKGEYIVVKDSINYELQNLRVNDELEDQTYRNLLEKFGGNVNESVNEIEELEIDESKQAN
jgi:FtsK/SpoIIIE family